MEERTLKAEPPSASQQWGDRQGSHCQTCLLHTPAQPSGLGTPESVQQRPRHWERQGRDRGSIVESTGEGRGEGERARDVPCPGPAEARRAQRGASLVSPTPSGGQEQLILRGGRGDAEQLLRLHAGRAAGQAFLPLGLRQPRRLGRARGSPGAEGLHPAQGLRRPHRCHSSLGLAGVGDPLLAGPHRRQPRRGFLFLLDLTLTLRKVENYSWPYLDGQGCLSGGSVGTATVPLPLTRPEWNRLQWAWGAGWAWALGLAVSPFSRGAVPIPWQTWASGDLLESGQPSV